MRRWGARLLRRWAHRLDPEPSPVGPFRLHTAASNLAPGTLYFDHYSGKVFRIGAGARLEDVTAYVADPSPRRVDLSVHVDGKDVGRFWENGR